MQFEKITEGLTNSATSIVEEKNTAKAVGSGSLEVLASPVMFALMEKAAADLLEKNLPQEFTSVGISLNADHVAPTPVGMKIKATAEITSIKDRKITLQVRAFDEVEEIGRGTHERFIVNREKFLQKAKSKFN